MRLCRYRTPQGSCVAFYDDTRILPWQAAAEVAADSRSIALHQESLLRFLPGGDLVAVAQQLHAWVAGPGQTAVAHRWIDAPHFQLDVPIYNPPKLLLLAGNYAAHIEEGGGKAVERAETFPYVFMKPPSTTLIASGEAFYLPQVSSQTMDYELELAVVMSGVAKQVTADQALNYVAGYTVVNDLSDRKFQPNPARRTRPRDTFFDWQHGKWHDRSCPCGPCITSADAIPDPQKLPMRLHVNGELRQDASTELQIFSVAEVIAFISSFVTLEPGDIISTGTCAGVGGPQGRFLQSGDLIEAHIEGIGALVTTIR